MLPFTRQVGDVGSWFVRWLYRAGCNSWLRFGRELECSSVAALLFPLHHCPGVMVWTEPLCPTLNLCPTLRGVVFDIFLSNFIRYLIIWCHVCFRWFQNRKRLPAQKSPSFKPIQNHSPGFLVIEARHTASFISPIPAPTNHLRWKLFWGCVFYLLWFVQRTSTQSEHILWKWTFNFWVIWFRPESVEPVKACLVDLLCCLFSLTAGNTG